MANNIDNPLKIDSAHKTTSIPFTFALRIWPRAPRVENLFTGPVVGNQRLSRGSLGRRELVGSRSLPGEVEFVSCDVIGTTEASKGTMVLQVLDLVGTGGESLYADCPAQTYTDLDVHTAGHITCTILPQGTN